MCLREKITSLVLFVENFSPERVFHSCRFVRPIWMSFPAYCMLDAPSEIFRSSANSLVRIGAGMVLATSLMSMRKQ